MTSKITDQGWFYHAPPKPQQKERVFAPPPSQIPGLSDTSHLPLEETGRQCRIYESDSKYIRLAKQGGRPDLLVMHTPEPPSSQPVGYPRCEWFYDASLNNNNKTDCNETREPYQFMLPDYMVHAPTNCVRKPAEGSAAERTPYAYDTQSAWNREGGVATDKTVKLAEDRPMGYGVRNNKQKQDSSVRTKKSQLSRSSTQTVQNRGSANKNGSAGFK